MRDLTATQARVLAFVAEHIREQQRPPTRGEICEHFGWRSANAAEDHLQRLEAKGYVRLTGRSRGIQVVETAA